MKKLNDFEFPILFAIMGFVYASCLLTCNGKGEWAFKEIKLSNQDVVVRSLLNSRKTGLDNIILRLEKSKKKLACPVTIKTGPCKEIQDSINICQDSIKRLQATLFNYAYNNLDTTPLYYSSFISIPRKTLYEKLQQFNGKDSLMVTARDSAYLEGGKYPAKIYLQSNHARKLITYIHDNPVMGYWLVLSIAQMAIWLLLGSLLPGRLYQVDRELAAETFKKETAQFNLTQQQLEGSGEQQKKPQPVLTPFDWSVFKSLITPVIAILLFIGIFYYYLIDLKPITDNIFLAGYSCRMYWYAIPGYLVAIVCFGVYIYAAGKLKDFNRQFVDQEKSLTVDAPEFKKLQSLFNSAFLATASVLSLFVLWMGMLFNAINEMEVMRFYKVLSGKTYLAGDFVYMVALLHTLLLLVFYVPVKLKFASMEVTQAAAKPDEPKKWLSFLAESLGTILLTASPLITGLIEKAISNLVNS